MTGDSGREIDDVGQGFASPACSMHEMDPAYFGYLDAGGIAALLRHLLADPLISEGAAGHHLQRHLDCLDPALTAPAGESFPQSRRETIRAALPRVADSSLHRDLTAALKALPDG